METSILFFLYYSNFGLCVVFYLYCIYKCRFKIASASNFAFAFSMIIIALPGFYVAEGTADKLIANCFYNGFDTHLYWIYFIFMPIVVIALILGQLAGQRVFINTILRKKNDYSIKGIFFICGVYCFLYLLWLPSIPLHNLLFSSSVHFADIYSQRIAITHGLGYEENLPFVFKYWRLIAQCILPALFYYFFITVKIKYRNTLLILFLFLCVTYLQVFTIEKAPFLSFFIGLIFLAYLRKQNEESRLKINKLKMIFRYAAGLTAIFMSFVFVYKSFMNVPDTVWDSIFSRLMVQSSSDYLQIDYVRKIGFLGFSGIKMPILSSLFNLEYINPSKYAQSILYPSSVMGEVIGTAGGMSLSNLYYIMGWSSVLVFFIFVFIFGYIDKIIMNSIYNPLNSNSFYLNISFYAMLTFNFAMAIGSNTWIVFAIPTIVSPPLILISAVYFMLVRVPINIFVKKRVSRRYLSADTVKNFV